LAAALLAALVWILRLLARRLIRILAGLCGLIALSILLTILVGIILFVITSPKWSGTYNNRAYGGSFRQIKKKAVQFKCGRLLANYRDLCLQLPLVLSDTSNICVCAFTVVVPGVRFNAFAIFLAPAFCFATPSLENNRC
jgi:hypothetical protein